MNFFPFNNTKATSFLIIPSRKWAYYNFNRIRLPISLSSCKLPKLS
jgi:hypothetical protein